MRFIDSWNHALVAYGDLPYVTQPDLQLHGSQVEGRVNKYTAALMAHGVKAGDTVAFYGVADAEWLLVQQAVLRAAGIIALVPPVEDEGVLVRLFAQAKPKYLFVSSVADADRAVRCMRAIPEIVQLILQKGQIRNPAIVSFPVLVQSGDLFLKEKAHEVAARAAVRNPDDIAVISFSQGTMGFPRSVAVSHTRLEGQVAALAERLGAGPAIFSAGRMELIDHAVLLWASIRQKREICFGAHPPRAWEWVGTAPEIADALFTLTWPIVGPQALPRGFARWRFDRQLAKHLKANFPHLAGIHTGFSVLPEPLRRQIDKAKLRLTWGFGLTESHGFATWEENVSGYGSLLPQIKLATHQGKLVFDYADNPTAWWQTTGDWGRTVGPWIAELEPHGAERGEPLLLLHARKVERDLMAHPWVAQAFVSGPEPLSNVALLTLRSHPVFAWARTQGLKDLSWESLLDRPELTEPLLQRVRAIGHKHGMALEPVILKRGFSEATGEVTARGELRRALIMRRAASYVQQPRPVQ